MPWLSMHAVVVRISITVIITQSQLHVCTQLRDHIIRGLHLLMVLSPWKKLRLSCLQSAIDYCSADSHRLLLLELRLGLQHSA